MAVGKVCSAVVRMYVRADRYRRAKADADNDTAQTTIAVKRDQMVVLFSDSRIGVYGRSTTL